MLSGEMLNRIYTISRALLCCCLLGSAMSLAAQTEVPYLERSWDKDKKQVVTTQMTRKDCKVITGKYEEWCPLGSGWYVIRGDVRRKIFNVAGEVHLILEDGCVMSAYKLKLEEVNGCKLYIYSQSSGSRQGRMVMRNNYTPFCEDAAIGSGKDNDMGSLYIHGGDISAIQDIQEKPFSSAAAIIGGGFKRKIGLQSEIVIFGGTVRAYNTVKTLGAGIGGGEYAPQGGPITIYGGVVEAYSSAAGIGGGGGYSGGTLKIYGGKVIAGKKPAKLGTHGAGIGGSEDPDVKIAGEGGDVHVYGGELYAYGSEGYPAIGGALDKWGGTLEVAGGEVFANGAYNPSNQSNMKTAPAIGSGGYGDGIHLVFTGGSVKAVTKASSCYPAPIGTCSYGKGQPIYNQGNLNLGEVSMLYGNNPQAADNEMYQAANFLYAVPEEERIMTLENHDNTCVVIQTCKHNENYYLHKNAQEHVYKCRHCSHALVQKHHFDPATHKCECGAVGSVESDVNKVNFYQTTDGKTYTTVTYEVLKGMQMMLPSPPTIDGLKFMGYLPNPTTAPATFEMKDSERDNKQLLPAGTYICPDKELVYYARYRYAFTENWAWSDDCKQATVTLTNPLLSGTQQVNGVVTEDLRAHYEPSDERVGECHFFAEATYQKAEGITYKFEDWNMIKLYKTVTVVLDAIDAEDKNQETLNKYMDFRADLTINNLTLKKDGKLHPLCLPFDCKTSGTPLAGATLYKMSGWSLADGNLTMQFNRVTEVEAGEPCFYCFESQGTDILHPTFESVIIEDWGGGAICDQYFELLGTYSTFAVDDKDPALVLVLDNNELTKGAKTVNAFSNYLYIPAVYSPDTQREATSLTLKFEGFAQYDRKIAYSWAGDGTADSPYIIKTTDQLKEMSHAFNINDQDVVDKHFRQAANITFDKTVMGNFTPINEFRGYYDGDGYSISGLNINRDAQYSALILEMYWGSVQNVIIRNSSFRGRDAAAIAAIVRQGLLISNCHVLKDVTIEAPLGMAGGIVAELGHSKCLVTECTSQATVNGYNGIGGVVGVISAGSITKCIYLGNSVTDTKGTSKAVVCGDLYPDASKKEQLYYTAPSLTDRYAKLMPDMLQDNTEFLTLLHQRDEFLLDKKTGLTKDDIGYDVTLSGRTMKATQNADGSWKSKTFSICLPFNLDLAQLGNAKDIKVYKLHEVDLDKKVLQFTNEFPLLEAGLPYLVTVEKGEVPLTAKNTTIVATPREPLDINTADGSKQVGWWCGTFKRIENDQIFSDYIYILQKDKTYQYPPKGYTNAFAYPFIGYFSALQSLGFDTFQLKFIATENGEETGEETDFPSDEFESDGELGVATGIRPVIQTIDADGTSRYYDLQGRALSGKPSKGVYIHNGTKVVVK